MVTLKRVLYKNLFTAEPPQYHLMELRGRQSGEYKLKYLHSKAGTLNLGEGLMD